LIQLPYPLSSLVKPPKGQPCNGCGWCCEQEVCLLGQELNGQSTAPCPSLVHQDGRTYCGLIRWASPEIAAVFNRLLGIGRGCCSDDPSQ